MRSVISPEEAARLDAEAEVSVEVLMDRAGRAVALAAAAMGAGYGRKVTVLAGPGNNGGDGYVAARYLRRRGAAVRVLALEDPRTEAARWARKAAEGVRIGTLADPIDTDLIIDALFGGGFRGGIPAQVEKWIAHPAPVLAVDFPSGLDPATGQAAASAFSAARTVTFHAHKTGHLLGDGPDRCGEVIVADIGLRGGVPTYLLTEESDAPLPVRPRRAHKWSAGSVLVVGGGKGMVGAALLAARAALRFGAGAVGVAAPEESSAVAMAAAPELLHYPIDTIPERYQVLVIGPGLGPDRDDLVRRLLAGWRGPVVADADALSALDRHHPARPGPLVLTPHQAEFRRLAGEEATPEAAASLASALEAVVLLKGNPTWVTDGSTPWAITSGGPELATIGTGDVLAGMIAALLAGGLEAEVSARSAAYWHGRAGAMLAGAGTVTAADLVEGIGRLR